MPRAEKIFSPALLTRPLSHAILTVLIRLVQLGGNVMLSPLALGVGGIVAVVLAAVVILMIKNQ